MPCAQTMRRSGLSSVLVGSFLAIDVLTAHGNARSGTRTPRSQSAAPHHRRQPADRRLPAPCGLVPREDCATGGRPRRRLGRLPVAPRHHEFLALRSGRRSGIKAGRGAANPRGSPSAFATYGFRAISVPALGFFQAQFPVSSGERAPRRGLRFLPDLLRPFDLLTRANEPDRVVAATVPKRLPAENGADTRSSELPEASFSVSLNGLPEGSRPVLGPMELPLSEPPDPAARTGSYPRGSKNLSMSSSSSLPASAQRDRRMPVARPAPSRPGLGVLELTVAFITCSIPGHRLIWDVGHQAYPHKIPHRPRDASRTSSSRRPVRLHQARGDEYDRSGRHSRPRYRPRSACRRRALRVERTMYRGHGTAPCRRTMGWLNFVLVENSWIPGVRKCIRRARRL